MPYLFVIRYKIIIMYNNYILVYIQQRSCMLSLHVAQTNTHALTATQYVIICNIYIHTVTVCSCLSKLFVYVSSAGAIACHIHTE